MKHQFARSKEKTNMAKLLEETSFTVWDEPTILHKREFQTLDKSLKNIRLNSQIMGGITVFIPQ